MRVTDPAQPPSDEGSPWPAALASLLVLIAAVPRWIAFQRGYIADEIGWVRDGGWAELYFDGETAVNPPLLRVLINVGFETDVVPDVGRAVSLVASCLAVAVVFSAARRAGRGDLAIASVAAALVALSPLAVAQAGWFRSYGVLQLVMAWHVWSLVAVADGEGRRGEVHLALSALLLPQLHYFTVPMLLLEGLALAVVAGPRVLAAYVPATLGFLPLAARILADGAREHLAPTDPWGSVYEVLTLGSGPRGVVVLAAAVVAVPAHRAPQRVLALACLAVAGAAILVGHAHDMRGDLSIVLLPAYATMVTSIAAAAPRIARWLLLAGLCAWVGPPQAERMGFEILDRLPVDGSREIATDLVAGRWDAGGAPIFLYPGHLLHTTHYYATRRPLMDPCPPWPDDRVCFLVDGTPVVAADELAEVGAGLVLTDLDEPVAELAARCTTLRSTRFYHAYDCR